MMQLMWNELILLFCALNPATSGGKTRSFTSGVEGEGKGGGLEADQVAELVGGVGEQLRLQ